MIILKSFLITAIISALIAFSLKNIFGFWETFCLSFAAQTILTFVYSSKKISREQQIVGSFTAEIEELLDISRAVVECPCGKNKFEDTVFVGIDNVFKCDVCNNEFRVDVTVTPTLITTPLSKEVSFESLVQKQKEL